MRGSYKILRSGERITSLYYDMTCSTSWLDRELSLIDIEALITNQSTLKPFEREKNIYINDSILLQILS